MKCPYCGTNNPVRETFCSNCGSPSANQANTGTSDGSGTETGGKGQGNLHMFASNTHMQNPYESTPRAPVLSIPANSPSQGYGPITLPSHPNAQSGVSQQQASLPVPPPPPPFYPNAQSGGLHSAPQQQASIFASPPMQLRKLNNKKVYVLGSIGVLVLLIMSVLVFVVPRFSASNQTSSTSQNGSAIGSTSSDPISTSSVNGEVIGLSYGKSLFDMSRPSCKSCNYKKQAAAKLAQGDGVTASSLWRAAIEQDSSDAEAQIYLEDQRVLISGSPYITIVVGTILSGPSATVGSDNLQGAYVAQKEFNAVNGAQLGGVEVRLLIANAGSSASNAQAVAKQIVQAAQKDSTIVGVMGWPFSAHELNAVPILTQAKIPMVSQTCASDDLTGVSSYFFRVAPTNRMESAVGAKYAKTQLNAQKAVVFADPSDSYSRSLGDDFTKSFTANSIGGQVVQQLTYTRDNAQSITTALQKVGQGTAPDLIYFAGYASDMNTLLSELPKYDSLASTKLLGGDALYAGGYDQRGQASFNRLHFTAFAYPDEWNILGLAAQKPAFFQDYINAFSASNPQGSYGFTRADKDVMLSYDATLALLTGAKNSAGGTKALTPEKLQQALRQINGTHALQGVSGQISFGSDGNTVNKAVVVLAVDPNGHIQMETQLAAGKFLP